MDSVTGFFSIKGMCFKLSSINFIGKLEYAKPQQGERRLKFKVVVSGVLFAFGENLSEEETTALRGSLITALGITETAAPVKSTIPSVTPPVLVEDVPDKIAHPDLSNAVLPGHY